MHDSSQTVTSAHPIAVVGIAAELPSGLHSTENLNHQSFHDFLIQGKDAYEKVPDTRFNVESWKGRDVGRVSTDTGCFLKGIDMFDHVEFGVSSKDARSMAVSTRKLLELSFLALLDSGIDYRSKNVGCYMAAVNHDILSVADPDEYEPRGSFAGIPCMVANRISYHLDLLGPSIPLDTACSSSLTAMHLAVQALRSGDCTAAIVGGCQLNHRLLDWLSYSRGSVLAPDGKCKPFDASADGFARGEGAVVVVVKLLEDAIRDGDRIYASILGTGINSSGSAAPISAPVAEAQRDAMLRAYANTGRSPSEVDFVELHATGTAAGDPTEANWIGEAFRRDDELLVGSVKGNVGHLEIAAFLASLTKVCSIFSNGVIPPNANFHLRNPAIKWDEYNLRVPVIPTPVLPHSTTGKALVSIASSGIGGSNGHVVVEAPSSSYRPGGGRSYKGPILLLAGGLSPRSATAIADDLKERIGIVESARLPSLAVMMGRRARQMTWRSAAILNDGEQQKLSFPTPSIVPRKQRPLAFVFAGQGPQHLAMGSQLYASYSAFRDSVDRSDAIYRNITGTSLLSTSGLFGCHADIQLPKVWPISATLPAIAIVQIALVDLLRSANIVPDIVLGHSAGETAMLYSSCRASREMVVQLAVARGLALSEVENIGGAMAAVSCSVEDAGKIIEETASIEEGLTIGCFNATDSITLSGPSNDVERAVDIAQERGFFAVKLRTKTPIHSSLVNVCRSSYSERVDELFDNHHHDYRPTTTTYSTLTGAKWTEPFTGKYFWETTRNPVKFTQAMTSVLRDHPDAVFVELSPHPVLASYIASHGVQPGDILCPMRRHRSVGPYGELKTYLETVGKLVIRGYNNINFASLYGNESFDLASIDIARYPFARKHIPYYPESSAMIRRQFYARAGPLSGPNLKVNSLTHPILAEHVIKGEPIMPAAGFLEMAFELGARQLWNVQFHAMLSLSPNNPIPVHIDVDELRWTVKSEPRTDQTLINASGYLSHEAILEETVQPLDLIAIKERCKNVNMTGFYESLEHFANYGPSFKRIQKLYKGEEEFLVQIRGFAEDLVDSKGYIVHPAILDSAIHIGVHKMATGSADNYAYFLPSRVNSVVIHELLTKGVPETLLVHAVFRRWMPDTLTFDFIVANDCGDHLLSLRGFEVTKHRSHFDAGITRRFDIVHKPVQGISIPIPIPPFHSTPGASYFVVHYVIGHEMDIQEKLVNVDPDRGVQIWFMATSTVDGGAARGFSRALRREMCFWDIRLVIFSEGWTAEMCSRSIHYLVVSQLTEQEIDITKEGTITTPRFKASDPPERRVVFKHNLKWQINDKGRLTYSDLPFVPKGYLLVDVERFSASEAGLRGFVGKVVSKSNVRTTVMGITDQALSNYVLVQEDWTMEINGSVRDWDGLPAFALGAVIAGLVLGFAALMHPSRMRSKRVVVIGPDGVANCSLTYMLSLLNVQHQSIEQLSHQRLCLLSTADIMASGRTLKADVQMIESMMPSYSKKVFWNDEATGARAMICKEPWSVSDAITIALRYLPSNVAATPKAMRGSFPEAVLESLKPNAEFGAQSLFDSSKTYLLIGGIGSMGIQISLWMYQNGARNLLLTSRNGVKSSSVQQNVSSRRILRYLQGLPALSIRLEACDATSVIAMKELLESVIEPIGGCMLLAAAFLDRTFFAHTQDSFSLPFQSKELIFRVLQETLKIEELDFLIAFSSGATFGNHGQTSYAAANTLLEGLLEPYANAFSLVCPLVLDSTIGWSGEAKSQFMHMEPWAITSEALCRYIGDGILKLNSGPFCLYIPDLDWNKVHQCMGPSQLYDHLVEKVELRTENGQAGQGDQAHSISRIITDQLGIDPTDFSSSMPLTTYGLDSLSASRLSSALKPLLTITQLQLLANVCTDDLISRLDSDRVDGAKSTEVKSSISERKGSKRASSDKGTQTIVKLCSGSGTPLILIHGICGDVLALRALQGRLESAIWAIQTTPETPLESIESISLYYYQEIKKDRSNGPYRLGSFSGTSIIAYQLAMTFEAKGDVVEQVVLIDHFPLMLCSPIYTWDDVTVESKTPSSALLRQVLENMIDLYRMDSNPARQEVARELLYVFKNKEPKHDVSSYSRDAIKNFESITTATLRFVLDLTRSDVSLLTEYLGRWMRRIKAPTTVYVASEGFMATLPPNVRMDWQDLGARRCLDDVEVIAVKSNHFTIMENPDFIQSLERLSRRFQEGSSNGDTPVHGASAAEQVLATENSRS